MSAIQGTFYDEDGNSRVIKREAMSGPWFDYDNQAWVMNGVYQRCGHLDCGRESDGEQRLPKARWCYGTQHEGEKPSAEIVAKFEGRQ